MKRCSKCGTVYEDVAAGFYRHRGGADGFASQCKQCKNERDKQYRAENRDKLLEYRKRYCRQNRDKVREYNEQYREENRDKIAERQRQYREENRDKLLDHKKQHYAENRDKLLEYRKRYYEQNRDKALDHKKQYYAENRDNLLEYRKQYHEENRDKILERRKQNPEPSRAAKQRRRARRRELPATFTRADWRHCLEAFNNTCAYCGAQQSFFSKLHQEHYIPLSAGGAYVPGNIVPACYRCNCSKCNKPPEEWIMQTFGRRGRRIMARIQGYFDSLVSTVESEGV